MRDYRCYFYYFSFKATVFAVLKVGEAWWCMPVNLALRRLKQGDLEFKVNLDNTMKPSLKKQTKKKTQKPQNN